VCALIIIVVHNIVVVFSCLYTHLLNVCVGAKCLRALESACMGENCSCAHMGVGGWVGCGWLYLCIHMGLIIEMRMTAC
jgi:hypothetical protein